jgi:hypothetical protein
MTARVMMSGLLGVGQVRGVRVNQQPTVFHPARDLSCSITGGSPGRRPRRSARVGAMIDELVA